MTGPGDETVCRVLCVDDNPAVAEALRVKLSRRGGFLWLGRLGSADALPEMAAKLRPDLILLDMDMPGRDALDSLRECVARCPEVRAIVFTGHVRRELIERAIDSGAWGYVSKNDGEEELLAAIVRVGAGELGMSTEAGVLYNGA